MTTKLVLSLTPFCATILLASLATASTDATTFMTGNALYSHCAVPTKDETATSICFGYIMAAADREVVFGPNDLRAGLEAAGG
jgi:hypothetical protein